MINVPKILNAVNWFALILLCSMMGLVTVLTIIGGIQSGDLTLSGLPLWFWGHKGAVYVILSFLTLGGVLQPLMKQFKVIEEKRAEENKDTTSDGLLLVMIVCGAFWPVVWSLVVFEWFREKIKGKEEDDTV